jgi:flagellar basal body-associated protein FliL
MTWILLLLALTAAAIVFFSFRGGEDKEEEEEEAPVESYVCRVCGETECICHKERDGEA